MAESIRRPAQRFVLIHGRKTRRRNCGERIKGRGEREDANKRQWEFACRWPARNGIRRTALIFWNKRAALIKTIPRNVDTVWTYNVGAKRAAGKVAILFLPSEVVSNEVMRLKSPIRIDPNWVYNLNHFPAHYVWAWIFQNPNFHFNLRVRKYISLIFNQRIYNTR